MMHKIYLPFNEDELKSHFAEVMISKEPSDTSDRQIEYYRKSVRNYEEYVAQNPHRKGKPISEMRTPCQMEKDERFWTASCLMTVFQSKNRVRELTHLFKKGYGDIPPINGVDTWEDCLEGELHLFFEANLPSPQQYKQWLRTNLARQQFIPYILDSDEGRKNLEGATNVDAILLNSGKGFAVLMEAKVLSDISCQVTYDVMRNQIARNIDVMLEPNEKLCDPLKERDPDKTLFLLLTPRIFKNNPSSRLYGYKLLEYMRDPSSLGRDLPHRTNCDLEAISKRLGWLTWEDFKEVNPHCCGWLDPSR